jgi:2-polyprenyl-6-hydroxyphenyl methylase/3-demethylubiquinone-9 3-methyltransferase
MFSADPRAMYEKRLKRTLKFISDLPATVEILDIGCQTGGFCAKLQRLGHKPSGIEIDSKSVDDAQRQHPGIPFMVGNCEKEIPFPDNSFDVVWAGEVIEHVGHTDVFINEINRVLRVGGQLILTTPMHNRLKNLGIVLFNFEKHFNPEFPHYRFYSKNSLSSVLTKRGFEVVEVDYIGRMAVVANVIFLVAKKNETKAVFSDFRLVADNRDPL